MGALLLLWNVGRHRKGSESLRCNDVVLHGVMHNLCLRGMACRIQYVAQHHKRAVVHDQWSQLFDFTHVSLPMPLASCACKLGGTGP